MATKRWGLAVLSVALVLTIGCRKSGDAGVTRRPLVAADSAVRGKMVSLIYSSNLRGEYEQCGCPVHPLGGVARSATLADEARGQADAVLHVDAGDLLLAPPSQTPGLVPPDVGERERRARLMLSSVARMGLTAFCPGEADFQLGPQRLRALAKEARVPIVLANVVDDKGQPLFEVDRIVVAAGLKIGIFGVLEAAPADAALWRAWGAAATKPVDAIAREVASLRARGAQIIVLLLHNQGGISGARRLLALAPGVDWAVLGHDGAILETPEDVGETRMVEAFQMGKHVGRLDLHVVDNSPKFADRGQRAQVAMILQDHERQLRDVQQRAAADKTGSMTEFFLKQTRALNQAIARETHLLQALPSAVTGSWFENRIFPLDESISDHPAVALLVAQYNQESEVRAQKNLPVGIAYRASGAAQAAPVSSHAAPTAARAPSLVYAGTAACGMCHAAALKFWQTTKHAQALLSLQNKGRDKDPACVPCHTTGYLRAGGTQDLNTALRRFRDVGCESCHGPGLDHIEATDKKTSIGRVVAAATCRSCHTPDQTNGQFDFALFRTAIVGPGHGGAGGAP